MPKHMWCVSCNSYKVNEIPISDAIVFKIKSKDYLLLPVVERKQHNTVQQGDELNSNYFYIPLTQLS